MQQNNAKQSVQQAYDNLVTCMESLNHALNSVERPENRQRIENTLGAVDNAIKIVNNTLANYQD